MAERLPDFMIVGAAKCGTTSLAKYLDEHKDIYISKKKEPKYFTYEFLKKTGYQGKGDHMAKNIAVKTFDDYCGLFNSANEEQILGEASVDTLYYFKQTIPKIKSEIGDPKIIIMLRNPVNRAISAYSHLIRDVREQHSFEEGLSLEDERLAKGYEFIWGYKKAGIYSKAVKAFQDNFSNVKVIIFEEFIKETQDSVYDVLEFLDVKTKHDFNESQHNVSGKPKNKVINAFLNKPLLIKEIIKKIIGSNAGVLLKNRVQKRNLDRISISSKTRLKLFTQFEGDIIELERLLGLELNNWKAKN